MVVATRVLQLAEDYEPPGFAHVPGPDAAIFLCAVDHRTGYRGRHLVDGKGPFAGSALMWELGLRAARGRPGLLGASALLDVDTATVGDAFRVDGETGRGPGPAGGALARAGQRPRAGYSGSAAALLRGERGSPLGHGGLIARLAPFDAYSDPLAKKGFLFAKICERRGWLEVGDPEAWEVSADNVLMRLALRSGLVDEGPLDRVRAQTRAAFKRLAGETGISPPLLDDLLWELGRDDPDLLGARRRRPARAASRSGLPLVLTRGGPLRARGISRESTDRADEGPRCDLARQGEGALGWRARDCALRSRPRPPASIAGSGGTTIPPPPPPHGGRAKIVDGLAVAPSDAPQKVVAAIAAANRIANGPPVLLGRRPSELEVRLL